MSETMLALQNWLLQYGDIALFLFLALGIVGLPLPDETLMVFTGALLAQGKLPIPSTYIAAFLGSMTGITLSYILGRTVGDFLIKKSGGYIGITEKKMLKAHFWFESVGKWSLFFGYFIPGVRHFTGYVAGSVRLEFPIFALFAYSGALLWVSTFLTIGYFIGNKWQEWISNIDYDVLMLLAVIGFVAVVAGYFIRKYLKRNKELV